MDRAAHNSESTALAFPDPQALAAGQVPQLVERIVELRAVLKENEDAAGAEELRRRLSAYERYVADKKARTLLEAESRRTEALIGWLSLSTNLVEWDGSGPLGRFRKLAENESVLEEMLAAGTTKRNPILVEIDRRVLASNAVEFDGDSSIRHGDFREVLADLPDNSVDMIFTDPPYAKEFVDIYGDIAEFGARVLRPGGSLLAYCGQYALPEILVSMDQTLRYWWTCACVHDGGNHKSLAGIRTYVLWKPIVWFVKDTNTSREFVYDAILRPAPDKNAHDWQQSIAEPLHYIEKLTPPGGLVVDPCSGGGTTGLAALQLGRRFVGAELNLEAARRAQGRIQRELVA